MDVKEAIQRRRSVRSFEDREVSRAKIKELMESVRMAPSASNRQDWEFVVVDDHTTKEKLYSAAKRQEFVKEAPVVVAGVATEPDKEMSCEVRPGTVDLSIALDHLTLRAAEEGLGTCWIGAFDQKKTKEILNLPREHKVIALMPLGYPTRKLEKGGKQRKPLEDIFTYNHHEE